MKSAIQIWRRQKTNYQNLGKTGLVVSKTRIIEAPSGFIGPYWVVLVQIEKNKRAIGQWVDEAEPKIGMKVVGVLRRIGETEPAEVIEYGVKWKKL
ncbi:MAG: hypothetical protein U0946_00750 [Patescibacteria group bacterium]|nr:hypothetical protein [Patescibacteria group bacterium]